MSDEIDECCRSLSDSFHFSKDVTCKTCGQSFPNSKQGIQEYAKHLERCRGKDKSYQLKEQYDKAVNQILEKDGCYSIQFGQYSGWDKRIENLTNALNRFADAIEKNQIDLKKV